MSAARSNIVLVGMPGAGKSTVGVLLAKQLGKAFVDTDLIIQHTEGRTLQAIVDGEGHMRLREIEARELARLEVDDHVIATGGSAVYSSIAMATLRRRGLIVYLALPWSEIEARITNLESRGIARSADQNLRDVYDEREPLYRHHADTIVDCSRLTQAETVERITNTLSLHFSK